MSDTSELEILKNELRNEKVKTHFLKRSLNLHVGSPNTGTDLLEVVEKEEGSSLCIVVLGASGDLAKKKTFPALFALYREELLDPNVIIFGFARSEYDIDHFRDQVVSLINAEGNEEILDYFKQRIFYIRGQYGSADDFKRLHVKVREKENYYYPNGWFILVLFILCSYT